MAIRRQTWARRPTRKGCRGWLSNSFEAKMGVGTSQLQKRCSTAKMLQPHTSSTKALKLAILRPQPQHSYNTCLKFGGAPQLHLCMLIA